MRKLLHQEPMLLGILIPKVPEVEVPVAAFIY
jgi:hypothetical protein